MATVLVIEDEANIRLFVSANLKARGHVVVEAETGTQGVETMQSAPPDLVILDMRLPDMSGVNVLQAMSGDPRLSAVPVTLMTASIFTSDADVFPNVVQRVVKPTSVKALMTAVDKALAQG